MAKEKKTSKSDEEFEDSDKDGDASEDKDDSEGEDGSEEEETDEVLGSTGIALRSISFSQGMRSVGVKQQLQVFLCVLGPKDLSCSTILKLRPS